MDLKWNLLTGRGVLFRDHKGFSWILNHAEGETNTYGFV